MGLIGAVFMIREWWPLYVVGMWIYMALVPPVEAAEQTIIQKVVPFRRQGRVFGVAAAMEAAAAPVTAFLIAPIAEFLIIPYMDSQAGQERWGWLLGEGEARGIALICLFAGLIMVVAATVAFFTRSYRKLTELYAQAPEEPEEGEAESEADAGAADAAEAGAGQVDAPAPVRGQPPAVPGERS
jgi:DHA3 family multidrug efflux protein-like MFS transporter